MPLPELHYSALWQAVARGDQAEIQRLLDAGTDVNERSSFGWTPLMTANDVAIVERLLAAGADISLVDEHGGDALSHALSNETFDVAQRLVEAGANVNQRNRHGWTRLRQAAFARDPAMIRWLLDRGADPSLERGKLLSAASWYGGDQENQATEQTIDLLVALGEDVHASDDHGYTALHCAVHDYAHTPSDETWWNASSDGSDISATRALLRHGADPNATGINGMTPLLLAAQSQLNSSACIELLLQAGAAVDKPGHGGITPLMRAAYRGVAENMRVLLAHGADPKRRDRAGHDARFYVQQLLNSLSASDEIPDDETEETATIAQQQEYLQEREQAALACVALLDSISTL